MTIAVLITEETQGNLIRHAGDYSMVFGLILPVLTAFHFGRQYFFRYFSGILILRPIAVRTELQNNGACSYRQYRPNEGFHGNYPVWIL